MKLTPMVRILAPAVAVLATLLIAGSAFAVPIVTTADGNGADTWLENDNQGCDGTDPVCTSTNTHGSDPDMVVRRLDGVRQKLALMRFDISDLDASVYDDAAIRFSFTSNRNRELRVYGILDGNDNWDEATTSYDNAPGIMSGSEGGPDAVAAEIGLEPTQLFPAHTMGGGPNLFQLGVIDIFDSEVPPGGGDDIPGRRDIAVSNPTSLPLGPFLNADTDGLVTFLMFLDVSNGNPTALIDTKENTAGRIFPAIGAIPEPASAVLLGLASVALCAVRRRK